MRLLGLNPEPWVRGFGPVSTSTLVEFVPPADAPDPPDPPDENQGPSINLPNTFSLELGQTIALPGIVFEDADGDSISAALLAADRVRLNFSSVPLSSLQDANARMQQLEVTAVELGPVAITITVTDGQETTTRTLTGTVVPATGGAANLTPQLVVEPIGAVEEGQAIEFQVEVIDPDSEAHRVQFSTTAGQITVAQTTGLMITDQLVLEGSTADLNAAIRRTRILTQEGDAGASPALVTLEVSDLHPTEPRSSRVERSLAITPIAEEEPTGPVPDGALGKGSMQFRILAAADLSPDLGVKGPQETRTATFDFGDKLARGESLVLDPPPEVYVMPPRATRGVGGAETSFYVPSDIVTLAEDGDRLSVQEGHAIMLPSASSPAEIWCIPHQAWWPSLNFTIEHQEGDRLDGGPRPLWSGVEEVLLRTLGDGVWTVWKRTGVVVGVQDGDWLVVAQGSHLVLPESAAQPIRLIPLGGIWDEIDFQISAGEQRIFGLPIESEPSARELVIEWHQEGWRIR